MSADPGREPVLHIALLHPEIGPNAGSIGRLCLGIGARLHLVHPLGFSTDEKAVRRAGLDYWRRVDVVEHADDRAFFAWAEGRRMHLFSARSRRPYTAIEPQWGDVLLFGRESVGLPPELLAARPGYCIPIDPDIRSLNLANAASIVAFGLLQRLEPARFLDPGP